LEIEAGDSRLSCFSSKSCRAYQPKRILEINPRHPIVQELKKRVELDENDAAAGDIAELMFDTALLTSGWTVENPAQFADKIIKMMNLGLNLDADAAPEDEDVTLEEPKKEQPLVDEDHQEQHHTKDEL